MAERLRDAQITLIRKIAKWNFWATLLLHYLAKFECAKLPRYFHHNVIINFNVEFSKT